MNRRSEDPCLIHSFSVQWTNENMERVSGGRNK